nr:hypothetical protein GCM10020092_083940 [Actinoplanes digitatis]
MCSLTSGAARRSATAARCATRAGSTGSAPPSDSFTPCGTTATPRSSSSARPGGRSPCACTDSATTSAKPRPGSSATKPEISGRQPMPTPYEVVTRRTRPPPHPPPPPQELPPPHELPPESPPLLLPPQE